MFSRGLLSNGRLLWCSTTHLGLQSPGSVKVALHPNRVVPSRRSTGALIPPSQYDIPISKKFIFPDVMIKYWELVPIFVTTAFSMFILLVAVVWACKHKVDLTFTHSRDNISRTMDLRNPSVHKMVIINQRYEPWPEMAEALEKMKYAEKRLEARLKQKCAP